ncbi:peptidoglycan-binding protein [Marinifilum sp.]|uniref:peptidoglycan-binding protein n=1 Tax=Marinifilum sp. TaxID=2033137 RepID=UPI003BAC4C1E
MMIKTHYLQELNIQSHYIRKGDKGSDVKRVQEWIKLWSLTDKDFKTPIAIDSDFGPVTLRAVKAFQEYKGLKPDGIIGNLTWRALTNPMKEAFSFVNESELADLIIAYCLAHTKLKAREIMPNKGSWVRAYTNGMEGTNYPWCMGFVMTILDQAYTTLGDSFINYVPYTLSCDKIGEYALKKKKFLRNNDILEAEKQIKPGDIFLRCSRTNSKDWTHTGFVVKVEANIIHTIEGNTNNEGSREGYEVSQRQRDLIKENLDIYHIMG